jgi:hypothetical protein
MEDKIKKAEYHREYRKKQKEIRKQAQIDYEKRKEERIELQEREERDKKNMEANMDYSKQYYDMLKRNNRLIEMIGNWLGVRDSQNDQIYIDIDRIIRIQHTQLKIINSAISAYSIHSKNKRAMIGLENKNIMDDTTKNTIGA